MNGAGLVKHNFPRKTHSNDLTRLWTPRAALCEFYKKTADWRLKHALITLGNEMPRSLISQTSFTRHSKRYLQVLCWNEGHTPILYAKLCMYKRNLNRISNPKHLRSTPHPLTVAKKGLLRDSQVKNCKHVIILVVTVWVEGRSKAHLPQ